MSQEFITKDERQIRTGYVHVRVGTVGKFGWYVGVLRCGRQPIWQCNHQHEDRGFALACVNQLVDAINGFSEPIRLRREW